MERNFATRLTWGCRSRPTVDDGSRRRLVRAQLAEIQMLADAGLRDELPLDQVVCAVAGLARDAEREAMVAPL